MNDEELKKWLEDKPREVGVAIASRAALRVSVNLPFDFQSGDKFENLTFTSLRCLLISSLAAKMPSDDIISARSAADSAADSAALFVRSAYSAARSALSAASAARSGLSAADSAALFVRSAYSAARSGLSAADSAARSATFEIWPEVEWDMEYIGNGKTAESLIDQPLFNTPNNDWSPSDFQKIENLKSNHPEYSWWAGWLIAMHNGTFRNWLLAYRIATEIPDDIWQQGAKPVAEKINEFQKESDSDEPIDPEEAYESLTREQQILLVDISKKLARTPKANAMQMRIVAKQIRESLQPLHNVNWDGSPPSILNILDDIAQTYSEMSDELQAISKSEKDKDKEIKRLTELLAKRDKQIAKLNKRLKKQGLGFFKTTASQTISGALGIAIGSAIIPMYATNASCDEINKYIEQLILNAPEENRREIEYVPIPPRRYGVD